MKPKHKKYVPEEKDVSKESFFEKKSWLFLTLILIFSFIIRFLFIKQLSNSIFSKPFGLDEYFYDNWALNISQGQIIGKTVFYALPLYPYFIGAIYWLLGHSLYIVRLVQIIIGTINCILVYLIGKRTFSKKIGLLSALMFSFYVVFIFHEGQLLSVTLAIFLNLSSILLLMNSFQRENRKGFFISGLLIGFASLTMAGILMFIPFLIFGMYYFLRKKESVNLMSLMLIIGILSPITLATLHNYIVEKDFIPITAHSGITFYTGNNPNARPYFSSVREIDGSDILSFIQGSRDVAEKDLKRKLKPSEVSRYWSQKAFRFIENDPAMYIKLVFQRFLLLLNSTEVQDVFVDYRTVKKHTPILNLAFLNFAMIIPFAFLGIYLNLRMDRNLFLLYSYMFSYSLAVALFMVNSRYRLPIVPILIIFSAYGLYRLYEGIKAKSKVLISYFVILLLAIVLTNLPLIKTSFGKAADYNVIGLGYMEEGDIDKAIEIFKEGIEFQPDYVELHNSIAQAYFHKGMLNEAEKALEKALSLRPDFPQAHNTLGVIYARKGLLDKSLNEYKIAAQLRPNRPDYHFNLGNAYSRKTLFTQAIEAYKKAINVSARPQYYYVLGKAYEHIGEIEKAQEAWENALKLDPSYKPARDRLGNY